MSRTIIYNGQLIGEGTRHKGYVAFEGETITHVGKGDPDGSLMSASDEAVDAEGAYILPGAIDDQVHFRDPGLTHKGDIETESGAAAAGGVTSFMDMPNTKPATVSLEAWQAKMDRAAEVSAVNYGFFLGATNDNLATLLEADYTAIPGVKLFLGSSTGNMLVDNDEALDSIFARVPALIAVHSEDEATIRANVAAMTALYGGNRAEVPVERHPQIRSREACIVCTRRAIERARRWGTRLHVLHISTADEAAMFSCADDTAKRITAEVCVHHLWFCSADYSRLGTRIKMNPAVKDPADREALREALREGRLDIVATDHAPHLLAEKEGGALTAASGAPMVQYSLPLMLEMADSGVFTHELVVEKMCHAPARLFAIERRGHLRAGYYADIVMVRPSTPYTISDTSVLSRCGWTPLDGTTLHNRVERTWVNGHLVYADGRVKSASHGHPLRFRI